MNINGTGNFEIKHLQSLKVFLVTCVLFLNQSLIAQQFLHTEGKSIVNEDGENVLLRGMGLGGWMLQEGYMLQTAEFASAQYQIKETIADLIGEAQMEEFYDAWLANHCTEQDIIAMKSWGFNSVRLPMHYNLFTLPIQEEPIEGENTWLEKGFTLTDKLISWCRENDMYVVLDLHAAPGGQGYDQGISDYDPTLPSLWESQANKDKMVALWKHIATRYADEPVIAGYDLLNEPNWDLGQNEALRQLYGRCTDAIREVDQKHIIFIEGNWFANDFNGLTPPWDGNLVYSPHKYWSFNDQSSIQWVLDLQNSYDVPLYLGESGENSNVWFKDAIELLESNNIGWAWWPLKKIQDIAGPLSIEKTEGYNSLLEYWKGNTTAPSASDAYDVLMDLTEKLKFENCRVQNDVIDAMFRQQTSSETLPYAINNVPGLVYATDFDLGSNGQAYYDTEDATYQVSTGNFTAWNNGWQYRNDGVDIEHCQDNTNTNGFNVAWTETDEWLKYTLNVATAGVYEVHLRTSAPNAEGSISFAVDESQASEPFPIPNTDGYQNWQTTIVPEIILNAGIEEVICKISAGGYNLSSLEFKYKSAMNSSIYTINKAVTIDQNTIELQFNKPVDPNTVLEISDFILEVSGQEVAITDLSFSESSNRKLLISTNETLNGDHQIRVSYIGNQFIAVDGTVLFNFEKFFVENNLSPLLLIPGLIQAESYYVAEGVEIEECLDIGQGFNIGFLDPGDYLEYQVNVEFSADYIVRYRTASEWATGRISLSFIAPDGSATVIDEPTFPVTGTWQSYLTTESEITLESGQYIMRIDILDTPFNMNWIEFESLYEEPVPDFEMRVSPNPFTDQLTIEAHYQSPHQISYSIFDVSGRLMGTEKLDYATDTQENIPVSNLNAGIYFLYIYLENDQTYLYKLYKN